MIIKIIKYAGTNGVAFVADFIVLVLLDTYTDINRSYIAFFCYLLGTCVSFVLAKNFVFGRGWLADRPALEFSAYFLGGIIGAIVITIVYDLTRPLYKYQLLIFGLTIIFTILFMPKGIGGFIDRYFITKRFKAKTGTEKNVT